MKCVDCIHCREVSVKSSDSLFFCVEPHISNYVENIDGCNYFEAIDL